MRTVLGGLKLLKLGDDTRPEGLKPLLPRLTIVAVKIVVEQDARLSVKDIASCTGISEGSVQNNSEKAFGPEKGLR